MERWFMLIVATTSCAKEPNVMPHSLVRTRPSARRRAGIAAVTAGVVALALAVVPDQAAVAAPADGTVRTFRSEERRVGKECRSWRFAKQEKQKKKITKTSKKKQRE